MASPKEFHGGVFSQNLPGGRAPARITVMPEGLRAQTDDARVFEVQFDSLELELGGASGRMMFCRNPDRSITLFCEERGFIFALTRLAGKHVGNQLGPMQKQLRSRFVMRVLGWTLVCSVLLGALWYLPVLVRWSLRSAVKTVPLSVDTQLGAAALAAMDLGGPPVHDAGLDSAVQTMIARLQAPLEDPVFTLTPHIIRRDSVNAFALPGGPLVIYTGLLRQAPSAEAVTAVIAHEMAHVMHRHGLERIVQSMGLVTTMHLLFGDVGAMVAVGREVLTTAAVNHYSRADEQDADRTAVRLLHGAGINPMALTDFFKVLEQRTSESDGARKALKVPGWVSDHPALAERIDNSRAEAQALPVVAWQPVVSDWPALQAQLKE